MKAGPAYQAVNPGADVITTASVNDLRHSPRGAITLRKGDVAYTAQYTYGTENDYKSHSIFVSAKTEAYEHDTQFELSYARNFDRVCDRTQAVNDRPPRFRALEDSTAASPTATRSARATRSSIDGLQAGWTQAWTPTFATQLAYTAQILDGFQSNPYRSVILAQGLKAQEHHPENRARQAVALRANLYIRPIKVAVRIGARVYRDTWDITSGTGERRGRAVPLRGLPRGRARRATTSRPAPRSGATTTRAAIRRSDRRASTGRAIASSRRSRASRSACASPTASSPRRGDCSAS